MRVGVTGHQERAGIDWDWVRQQIDRFLSGKAQLLGFTSLAVGTDQIFAEAVLHKNGKLTAVIPIEGYVSYFEGDARARYERLLASASVVTLRSTKSDEQAFLDAGKWIVREVDYLIAVWDGEPAEGAGGTGDIVDYARSLAKPVLHINPIERGAVHL